MQIFVSFQIVVALHYGVNDLFHLVGGGHNEAPAILCVQTTGTTGLGHIAQQMVGMQRFRTLIQYKF